LIPEKKSQHFVEVLGKRIEVIFTTVCLPEDQVIETIETTIEHFQTAGSLAGNGQLKSKVEIMPLNCQNLERVQITIDDFPVNCDQLQKKLFEYFKLGMGENSEKFIGFDCLKFVGFIYDIEIPQIFLQHMWSDILQLHFAFELLSEACKPLDTQCNLAPGHIVAFSISKSVDGIRHWGIYLGRDIYISKFGAQKRRVEGGALTELVSVAYGKALHELFSTEYLLIARPNPLPKLNPDQMNLFQASSLCEENN